MTTTDASHASRRGRARGAPIASRVEPHSLGDGRWMVGDWLVRASSHRLERDGTSVALEPRMVAVLAELSRRAGEVVSAETLLHCCWPGEPLGDNPIHKVIAGLRRALGDNATASHYIETIRKQGYRLVAPIRALSAQGPRGHQDSWRGQSPFRGLEAFGRAHADVFFGRDQAVSALHARLGAQWERGHPLVVLLGPSGSGKTSLVQAGLLPALFASGIGGSMPSGLLASTAATADLGSADDFGPWAAIAGALLDWEIDDSPLLSGYSIASLSTALRDEPERITGLVRGALDAAAAARPAGLPPPLLVLDRLEGLFKLADAPTVIACIDRFVRLRLTLVVAICRNDFYPSLAAHAPLMRDKERGAHMDLASPGAEAIAQMIRLPARAAGLTYGADASGLNRLDDRLCADAMQTRDALPLLQYTLQELYLQRAPGDELTWAAYDAMGGLDGAIGRRAEATLSALPTPQQEALARVLPRLVGLPVEDAAPTGRWVAMADLGDEHERALVRELVQARLLVADHLAGKPGCRVAHEALLRSWPRVIAWVAQHREMLTARDRLLPWVQRWLDGGRSAALLLPRGAALWQASTALTEAPQLFPPDAHDYVARSGSRLRRQARWRWGGTACVACLAVVAALVAVRNAKLARVAAERDLESQHLASFMLGDLADQLRPMGRLDVLGSIGEQGLRVLAHEGAGDELPAQALQRAKALVVIGEVDGSRGKGRTGVAIAALDKAQRLLESLAPWHGAGLGDYYKTLGAAAFWRGQIAFDQGDLVRASTQMSTYREACERWLAAVPDAPDARKELGFALNSLGSIAMRRGTWVEAGRWFEASLALKQAALAARPGDAEALDAVASSRTWLGLVTRVRGEPRKALAMFDAVRATRLALRAAHPDEYVRVYNLGILEIRRAEALRDLGERGAAARAMDDAVAWLGQAVGNDPSNRRWQGELAHAEAERLFARSDAGLPVGDAPGRLAERVARAAQSSNQDNLREETAASLATTRAVAAVEHADWPLARSVLADAGARLRTLMAARPLSWQLNEFQARLALLYARVPDTPERTAACAAAAVALRPAVDSQQAGLVQEAWLVARTCSGAAPPDAAALAHLTAGGYRPAALISLSLPQQRGSP